jgi:protein-disulfide isomerase
MLHPPVSDADRSFGPADAAVTLVEYGDYECPHCGRAHPIVHDVIRHAEALGVSVRFVFRYFPLAEAHPHAQHAAEAAESVAVHAGPDAFWRMHDALFTHQKALDDAHLVRYAVESGADATLVEQDLANSSQRAHVRSSFMGGVRSGVNGTPTFYINGTRYDDDWGDVWTFVAALRGAAGR